MHTCLQTLSLIFLHLPSEIRGIWSILYFRQCFCFVSPNHNHGVVLELYPSKSQSGLVWCCSAKLWSIGQLSPAVSTSPAFSKINAYLTASSYQDCFFSFLGIMYIYFMKLKRHRKHWEENGKLPDNHFPPEWGCQGEGENRKSCHHVRAGPAVVLQLLAVLRPCSKESWKDSTASLHPPPGSAVVVKIAVTKLH